jgi:hypothetical protein
VESRLLEGGFEGTVTIERIEELDALRLYVAVGHPR